MLEESMSRGGLQESVVSQMRVSTISETANSVNRMEF